ncbi:MAG TPA: molybdopterin-binding protein [Anaeromyxobacteraceae bacterium]|nr:molybdopterin-binding protein [Anaeromyxobacteraceae bacterium]
MTTPTAVLLVVGNEVLSAKVEDANGPWLARRLRELGVQLLAIHTLPDEMEEIAATLDRERRRATWVFTSGGVGPTHDDVTVCAVARALGLPISRCAPLAEAIHVLHASRHGGEEAPEAALRMADVPEGTRLVGDAGFPTLVVENVVMLPGVPQFFRWQFERFAPTLRSTPFWLASVYLSVGETEIAPLLDAIARDRPDVAIGSYPRFDDADHRVRVTLESKDRSGVESALGALLAALPPGSVTRTEGP